MAKKQLVCSECGRPIKNAYFLNGRAYGYNCYRSKLALIYRQYEDEKNAEYSAKCFSAMQVFAGKRSNPFHDSVCQQWQDCHKLTARQLDCIISKFTADEKLKFWSIWQPLSRDICTIRGIAQWTESVLINDRRLIIKYLNDDYVMHTLFAVPGFKHGFYVAKDKIEDLVYIMEIRVLEEDEADPDIEILKVFEKMEEKDDE